MVVVSIVVAVVALVVAVLALRAARDAQQTAGRLSRAADAEREQREREREALAHLTIAVEVGPEHEVGDDGMIWATGAELVASLVVVVANDGGRPSGRTQVDVWVPRVDAGDPWWADEADWTPLEDAPKAVPDEALRLNVGGGAPSHDTVRLSRVIDRIDVGVPHRLALRTHFPLEAGPNAYPVGVVARGEGTAGEARHREVVRILRRY